MKENSIQTIVVAIDPVNAEYIMQNDEIVRTFHGAAEYIREGKTDIAAWAFKEAKKRLRCLGSDS